jgi:hypothetical protein
MTNVSLLDIGRRFWRKMPHNEFGGLAIIGQFYTKSLILPSSFYIMSSTLKKAKQCIPAEIRMISGCRDAQISTPSGFKNNL